MFTRSTRVGGMTLIEVLVALVIVAVAILALARSGAQSLNTQFRLESQTFGLMVAENVLAEIKLQAPARPGRRDGQMRMADQDWLYQVVIQPTADESMLRVDVGVFHANDPDIAVFFHTGFVSS